MGEGHFELLLITTIVQREESVFVVPEEESFIMTQLKIILWKYLFLSITLSI